MIKKIGHSHRCHKHIVLGRRFCVDIHNDVLLGSPKCSTGKALSPPC
jgi:hypothetical protein